MCQVSVNKVEVEEVGISGGRWRWEVVVVVVVGGSVTLKATHKMLGPTAWRERRDVWD